MSISALIILYYCPEVYWLGLEKVSTRGDENVWAVVDDSHKSPNVLLEIGTTHSNIFLNLSVALIYCNMDD